MGYEVWLDIGYGKTAENCKSRKFSVRNEHQGREGGKERGSGAEQENALKGNERGAGAGADRRQGDRKW